MEDVLLNTTSLEVRICGPQYPLHLAIEEAYAQGLRWRSDSTDRYVNHERWLPFPRRLAVSVAARECPSIPTATEFINPITDAAYRVRIDANGGAWRITKSTLDPSGKLTIRHLRGSNGIGIPPPPVAVERLLHGKHQAPMAMDATITADPHLGFALIVLVDIDHSVALMTEMAYQARQRRDHGMRGFRPGCASLRDQERRFLDGAIEGCRRLAHAWIVSGLGETPGVTDLPEWLKGALEDAADHPFKTNLTVAS